MRELDVMREAALDIEDERMDEHDSHDLEPMVWVVQAADEIFIFQDSNDADDCARTHGISVVLCLPVRIAWRP